ncbi:sensor histidine kinase [Mycetocola saprophilus]|uniref:sensor histidine kinase n=1 Tax=Mycetocola saprophilus TaxID=76636 RepID=UPI0004C04444|nr:histidine kinase [Mycetocola saprophilus]
MTTPPPPLPPSGAPQPIRVHTGAGTRGRAFLRGLVTTVWVTLGIFFSIIPLGQHLGDADRGIPPTSPGIAVAAGVGTLLMIGASILLVWRTRWPYLVTAIAAAIAILLPTTPIPALIALVSVLHRRRGPWVWILTGAVALACGVATRWDSQAVSNSLVSGFAGRGAGPEAVLASLPWAVPLSVFLLMLPFVSTGLILRARSERDVALVEVEDTRQSAATLSDEVTRQRERQEVAREIHDTLASRLSTLSLHAGALEVNARESDTALAGAASVVRESAQRSLDDLRYVVDVLRDPAQARGARITSGRTSLADLPDLIEAAEALPGGIVSNVFLSDAAGCDPRVAHACYRIVQEALANARRHAPGQTVSLSLRGGPGAGLTLTLTNPAPEGLTPTSVGGGHGVTGMTERAQLLGGTLTARTDDNGVYGIYAWLPWIPPEPAAHDALAAPIPA